MLQTVSQAMKIISKDLRNDKLQIVWTIIFMLYMATVLSFFVNSMFQEPEFVNPFADFLMLVFIPMLGFIFSRRSFKYLTEDSYTQMLFYYRSIPVPTEAVIMSRALMGIGAFIVNGTIFFGVTYAIASDLRANMSLASYVAFGLTWIGIGILINGSYVYFECMKNGKSYFWTNFLFTLVFAISILGLFFIGFRFSLFNYLIDVSGKWKLLSPYMWGSLIIGILGYALMCRLTYKRIRLRDLS